jgi:hypothetical protein
VYLQHIPQRDTELLEGIDLGEQPRVVQIAHPCVRTAALDQPDHAVGHQGLVAQDVYRVPPGTQQQRDGHLLGRGSHHVVQRDVELDRDLGLEQLGEGHHLDGGLPGPFPDAPSAHRSGTPSRASMAVPPRSAKSPSGEEVMSLWTSRSQA